MKGRTLSDQNRMRIGGVTKMNVGGSLIDRSRAAIAANKAAKSAAPPKPAPSMAVPGKGTLIDKARRVIADRGAVKPRAQPIMSVPGMSMGGATKMNTGGSLLDKARAGNANKTSAAPAKSSPIMNLPAAKSSAQQSRDLRLRERDIRREQQVAAHNAKKEARNASIASRKSPRAVSAMPAAGMKIGGRTYGRR